MCVRWGGGQVVVVNKSRAISKLINLSKSEVCGICSVNLFFVYFGLRDFLTFQQPLEMRGVGGGEIDNRSSLQDEGGKDDFS